MKIKKRQDDPNLKKGDVWHQNNIFLMIACENFSIELNPIDLSLRFRHDWHEGSKSWTLGSIVYRWEEEKDED